MDGTAHSYRTSDSSSDERAAGDAVNLAHPTSRWKRSVKIANERFLVRTKTRKLKQNNHFKGYIRGRLLSRSPSLSLRTHFISEVVDSYLFVNLLNIPNQLNKTELLIG